MTNDSFAARKVAQLKREWRRFRQFPAGQRFQIHHEEAQRHNRSKPTWLRVLRVVMIPVLLAVGVVLSVLPGPAILFFFLAAALLASHSLWVARLLDRTELAIRTAWRKLRNRHNGRGSHTGRDAPESH